MQTKSDYWLYCRRLVDFYLIISFLYICENYLVYFGQGKLHIILLGLFIITLKQEIHYAASTFFLEYSTRSSILVQSKTFYICLNFYNHATFALFMPRAITFFLCYGLCQIVFKTFNSNCYLFLFTLPAWV